MSNGLWEKKSSKKWEKAHTEKGSYNGKNADEQSNSQEEVVFVELRDVQSDKDGYKTRQCKNI